MAKLTMEEQPEYSVLPTDSILLLKIEDVEVQEVNGRNGTWQKLNFTFKVLDIIQTGDGSPKDAYSDAISGKIWGSVPYKLTTSPENKLRQWVEAIYGMELSVGFELDTDLLVGKQVRAVTSQYTSKAGYPRHQVDSLLPYGAMQAGTAPIGQAPTQDPWATDSAPATAPAGAGAGGFSYDDEPPF